MKRTDFRSDKRKRDALTIHYSLPAKRRDINHAYIEQGRNVSSFVDLDKVMAKYTLLFHSCLPQAKPWHIVQEEATRVFP